MFVGIAGLVQLTVLCILVLGIAYLSKKDFEKWLDKQLIRKKIINLNEYKRRKIV